MCVCEGYAGKCVCAINSVEVPTNNKNQCNELEQDQITTTKAACIAATRFYKNYKTLQQVLVHHTATCMTSKVSGKSLQTLVKYGTQSSLAGKPVATFL